MMQANMGPKGAPYSLGVLWALRGGGGAYGMEGVKKEVPSSKGCSTPERKDFQGAL